MYPPYICNKYLCLVFHLQYLISKQSYPLGKGKCYKIAHRKIQHFFGKPFLKIIWDSCSKVIQSWMERSGLQAKKVYNSRLNSTLCLGLRVHVTQPQRHLWWRYFSHIHSHVSEVIKEEHGEEYTQCNLL